MRYGLGIFGAAALLFSSVACNEGRYGSSGFHLPADASADRGKVAFVNIGCNSCHKVWGADLPQASVSLPEPVMLGGQTGRRLSDAYLMTVMLDPNHALAGHRKRGTAENERSRMESYTDQLSARQMVDIVAFLQAHYVVRHFTPNNTFE
jgi:hypothetical protein